MGLLDFLPDMLPDDPQKREAAKMGLLQLGAQMMGSRGNFGQSLGQGLLGGLQGYSQQMESGQQKQLRDMQIAQAKRAETLAQGQQQWMANMPRPQASQGQMDEEMSSGYDAAPKMTQPSNDAMKQWAVQGAQYNPAVLSSLLGQVMPKTPEWTVGERFNADTGRKEKVMYDKNSPATMVPFGGQEAVRGIAVNGQIADPTKIGTTVAQQAPASNPGRDTVIPDGKGGWMPNPARVAFEQQTAPLKAPKVTVTNVSSQETEQSKAYGKSLGESRAEIAKAGFNAPAQMAKLDRIAQLLEGVDGGKLAPTGLQLASAANSLGLKLDPNMGNKEAAEALSRELAGGLRQPGTGVMTDKDFENFLAQMPDLSKSAEGRKQIIATSKAKLARDIEVAKLAREYAKKNGGVIDDGFMDIVSDYVAKNPVVQRTSTSGRDNQFPDASAIDAELRNRGRTARGR